MNFMKLKHIMFRIVAIIGMNLFIPLSYSQVNQKAPEMITRGATPEKAGEGFAFTEGCSVSTDGRVFFTDQPNDKIYVWDETTGISLFKEDCERSNGTFFDREGNLITCADRYNKLVKFTPEGELLDVYTAGFNGQHLNGPNDLWLDGRGGIYFTDPFYRRDYWESGHNKEQDVQGVYYLRPSGELIRVIGDLVQPNGIVGTPDGNTLYIADIGAGTTWKYQINPDGTLSKKTNFAPAGSDGMTLDSKGNVYLTYGKVLIFDKEGNKTGEIELPESPSNICFGGRDRKTLFITARTSVYTVKMKVRGVE
jgi:gluconolactonase